MRCNSWAVWFICNDIAVAVRSCFCHNALSGPLRRCSGRNMIKAPKLMRNGDWGWGLGKAKIGISAVRAKSTVALGHGSSTHSLHKNGRKPGKGASKSQSLRARRSVELQGGEVMSLSSRVASFLSSNDYWHVAQQVLRDRDLSCAELCGW